MNKHGVLGTSSSNRDVSHLGDFTVTPRMLVIAALAVPVGAVSACVAWALLRLIGLITNAVFYGAVRTPDWSRPGSGTTTRRSCCSRRWPAAWSSG